MSDERKRDAKADAKAKKKISHLLKMAVMDGSAHFAEAIDIDGPSEVELRVTNLADKNQKLITVRDCKTIGDIYTKAVSLFATGCDEHERKSRGNHCETAVLLTREIRLGDTELV